MNWRCNYASKPNESMTKQKKANCIVLSTTSCYWIFHIFLRKGDSRWIIYLVLCPVALCSVLVANIMESETVAWRWLDGHVLLVSTTLWVTIVVLLSTAELKHQTVWTETVLICITIAWPKYISFLGRGLISRRFRWINVSKHVKKRRISKRVE